MIDVSALQLLLLAVVGWLDRREREAMAQCPTIRLTDFGGTIAPEAARWFSFRQTIVLWPTTGQSSSVTVWPRVRQDGGVSLQAGV